MRVRLFSFQKPLLYKLFNYFLAAFAGFEPFANCAGFVRHLAELINNGVAGEAMTLGNFGIQQIMRGRYFNGAGAEFHLNRIIGHHRNFPVLNWKRHFFAD